MIITVHYKDPAKDEQGMMLTQQAIECARYYKLESKTHWGFMAYNHDGKMIAEHRFKLGEGYEAYVTEQGTTVDVLPRR